MGKRIDVKKCIWNRVKNNLLTLICYIYIKWTLMYSFVFSFFFFNAWFIMAGRVKLY